MTIWFRSNGEPAYRFLSNMHACVMPTGQTLEHAYQASKAADETEAAWVLAAPDPYEAKRRGRTVRLDPAFEPRSVMRQLLRVKFHRATNPALVDALLATGDAELREDNAGPWGGRGSGANWLGSMLMELRAELRDR